MATLSELKAALRHLEEVRRQSTGPGAGAWCSHPETDAYGYDGYWVDKPRTRAGVGHTYPDGTVLETGEGGVPRIWIRYGPHGRRFLAVESDGIVYCQACRRSLRDELRRAGGR